ncbi:hypothetical protein H0H93_001175 [Arthromyces matolae]|nr:hypothetical protein H0H93_001175 [Arthromyces matolae]
MTQINRRPPRDARYSEATSFLTPLSELWSRVVALVCWAYVADILRVLARIVKLPLAYLGGLWIIAFFGRMLLSNVCMQTGMLCISRDASPMPGFGLGTTDHGRWANFPALVDLQTATFDSLLHQSAGSSALSLEIKKAEMAATDISVAIRMSHLQSKDILVDVLKDFIQNARTAGRNLQRLSSKIEGVLDRLIATNEYVLRQIKASPQSTTVLSTFELSMNELSVAIQKLILEAETNNDSLMKLEESLLTLQTIIVHENSDQTSKKEHLNAEFWTILGLNKRRIQHYDAQLSLLTQLTVYRKMASVYVSSALQTLIATSSDLEVLRETVAAFDIVGSVIPVEVHIRSIEMGVQNLLKGRGQIKV